MCVANSNFVALNSAKSKSCHAGTDCYDGGTMRDLAILFIHLLACAFHLFIRIFSDQMSECKEHPKLAPYCKIQGERFVSEGNKAEVLVK